jgi:uncharacterized membrane protein YfcA/glyoxylase-like metal-dependent hydrolase (beta-lactamase superfamily II)/rhodanese-related sulfurtransferase
VVALAVAMALLVGVSLGLLGGGGSILAVPLLVYVAGLPVQEAVATSLFVVGVTSLAGLVPHARAGRVRWRTGLVFGGAGMAGSYLGGRVSAQVPGTLLLVAFAVMMLATALAMIRGRRSPRPAGELRPLPALGLGVLVGAVTGFVGAGGGFLIVPALVLVGGLPMVAAIGTSLLVISMQSAAGLAGHLSGTRIPWPLALAVTLSAVLGSLVGSRLCGRFRQDVLRRGFGRLVLVMAVLVLVEQLPRGPFALPLAWPAAAFVAVTALTVLGLRRAGRRSALMPATAPGDPSTSPSCPTDSAMEKTVEPTTATTAPTTMHFAQFYLDCLSQASYLIGDTGTGQAVVVDPRRDIAEYLSDAEQHGLRIVGVINTHFHADFLSGHLEMAAATGAWIGYGEAGQTEFESRSLADGERIVLGDVALQVMATPGHTPESISVLVFEHAEDEVAYGVLTGDALFIGDVGRPDLLASIGFTADQLGSQLYDSIQHKLMGLDDAVRVFPAHGAGSACGKNLSIERQSTIGRQRLFNYACQPMSEEQFVALVTAGQPAAPEYFVYDAILNRKSRDTYDADRLIPAMSAAELDAALSRGAVVLDTRDPMDFAAGHLAGSINVPADGRFAETVGMALQPGDEVVVIAPDGGAQEIAVRLARIGFDHTLGYLPQPEALFLDRAEQVRQASRLTPAQLAALVAQPGQDRPVLLDVRNVGEVTAGMIPGAVNIPLAELTRRIDELPAGPVVAYCAGGWRSSVAASLLRRHGHPDSSDLLGGFAAWQAMHEPVAG